MQVDFFNIAYQFLLFIIFIVVVIFIIFIFMIIFDFIIIIFGILISMTCFIIFTIIINACTSLTYKNSRLVELNNILDYRNRYDEGY